MDKKIIPLFLVVISIISIIAVSGCVGQGGQQQNETQYNTTPQKLLFSPPEILDATEGTYYSYSFCKPDSAISGATCGGLAGPTINPYWGNPPYSFSVDFGEGFLPPGLALELNGLLRGTPTLAGNYTFSVCAKDGQDEVCGKTTLIVDPAKNITISPINITNITINVTPNVTVSDVKINSFTCQWTVKTDSYGNKNDCVRIIAQGTAQGPVGARLELPILAWSDDDFDCGTWTKSTGALIAVGDTCRRKEGQPETTTWKVDTGDPTCVYKSYWNNARSYSAKIYLDNDIYSQNEDSKSTVCQ